MILYIDTLGGEAKIWLDDEPHVRAMGRQMSDELMGFVMDLLDDEVPGGIVVHKASGSFTGARLGAALANTLAEVYGLPIVAAGGDDWRKSGAARIKAGESDDLALPEYD